MKSTEPAAASSPASCAVSETRAYWTRHGDATASSTGGNSSPWPATSTSVPAIPSARAR